MGKTYLNTPSTPETIVAVDQHGLPYTGDLSGTTVTSSAPDNVVAVLGSFDPVTGQAVLTLSQAGGFGEAIVKIANGATELDLDVLSYVPVLTAINILPSSTSPTVAPVAPVVTAPPAASTTPAVVDTTTTTPVQPVADTTTVTTAAEAAPVPAEATPVETPVVSSPTETFPVDAAPSSETISAPTSTY